MAEFSEIQVELSEDDLVLKLLSKPDFPHSVLDEDVDPFLFDCGNFSFKLSPDPETRSAVLARCRAFVRNGFLDMNGGGVRSAGFA